MPASNEPLVPSRWSTAAITAALVWSPAALLAIPDPGMALGGVPDLGLLVLALAATATARPALARQGWVRGLLVVAWATCALFGLAWTASLVATRERLPLYDLLLLARPLWVFAADLYGAALPWLGLVALVGLGLGALALVARGWGRLAAAVATPGPHRRWGLGVAVASVLAGPVTGPWTPRVIADLTQSAQLYGEVAEQLDARDDLAGRALASTPDVRLYVVESYGDVVLEPPVDDDHRALLAELEADLQRGGWSIASGRSVAPTHGGRSWLSDATVFTGIEVDRQATFGHVTAIGRSIPTLPSFFAEQGYATVLVRPKDRARPGVRLVNHFGFATTVFHDELAYDGPNVGWGHIPDQYTVDVVEQDVLSGVDRPVFAFFHLATSHYPWDAAPPLLADARDWALEEGGRDTVPDRRPLFALGMELRRFRTGDRELDDPYGADLFAFAELVGYDLQVLARALPGPDRPTLMVWYGDHQPPFLADADPPWAVMHVLASDPAWLEPFLADGFVPGLDPGPRRAPRLTHRDLFERITRALGDPARRGDRPAATAAPRGSR